VCLSNIASITQHTHIYTHSPSNTHTDTVSLSHIQTHTNTLPLSNTLYLPTHIFPYTETHPHTTKHSLTLSSTHIHTTRHFLTLKHAQQCIFVIVCFFELNIFCFNFVKRRLLDCRRMRTVWPIILQLLER